MPQHSFQQANSSDRTRDVTIEVLALENAPCSRKLGRYTAPAPCTSRRCTSPARFLVLCSIVFLNWLSVATANCTGSYAMTGATKRLAPKLSRVEIDVDYSSLLRPAIASREPIAMPPSSEQTQSKPIFYEPFFFASADASPLTSAEDSSSSSAADIFALRLRGGMELRMTASRESAHHSAK